MKNWQKHINAAKKFARKGSEFLHDCVQELVLVKSDPEFHLDMKEKGIDSEEFLSSLVTWTCANFSELQQMLKMFPNKKQWGSGNLGEMRVQVIRSITKHKETESEEQKRIKKKSKDDVKSWKEEAIKLRAENDQLRAENRFLRRELKDLKEMIKAERP